MEPIKRDKFEQAFKEAVAPLDFIDRNSSNPTEKMAYMKAFSEAYLNFIDAMNDLQDLELKNNPRLEKEIIQYIRGLNSQFFLTYGPKEESHYETRM